MKRCMRTVWKTMIVHSHAFYKEWVYISRRCVAIVNHKRVIYWVNNYTKMKYMLGKHDAWRGAMVWPHRALVKFWECFPYVVMQAFHKSNHHQGSSMVSRGKSPRLKGGPNFLCPLSMSFFLWWTYTLQITTFKFDTFPGSFTIFRDYVHFLGINAHNSSSNNRCMKGCVRTVWKMMSVPFSKFSCLLQGMDRYFDEMCGNSQPQTFVYWVFNYRKKMK